MWLGCPILAKDLHMTFIYSEASRKVWWDGAEQGRLISIRETLWIQV